MTSDGPHQAWYPDELLHFAADNWPDGGPLRTSSHIDGLEREVAEDERGSVCGQRHCPIHAQGSPLDGRVVYAAELRPGRWATVEEWIPAELLVAE